MSIAGTNISGLRYYAVHLLLLTPALPLLPADLPGEPGARAVCPLYCRQYFLWLGLSLLRVSGPGCPEGQCPQLHHRAAGRLPHRYPPAAGPASCTSCQLLVFILTPPSLP